MIIFGIVLNFVAFCINIFAACGCCTDNHKLVKILGCFNILCAVANATMVGLLVSTL